MSQAEAFVSKWMFATLNGSGEGAACAFRRAMPGAGPATTNSASGHEDACPSAMTVRFRRRSD